MWYRRALFVLAVTGPTASLLVHCTEFGADGEPSPDGSTTATTTSTAPPIPKADASATPVDAAVDRTTIVPVYRGETIADIKATAPASTGYFVHKRKGEAPWFFYLNNQNAIATADGGTWTVDQATRTLAVLDSPAEDRGARAGRLAASLRNNNVQPLLIGQENQEPNNVPKPYATISAGSSHLYIAVNGSSPTVYECSVNVVEATACTAVAAGLSPSIEAFSVDADRFVLYRAEAGGADAGADAGAGAVMVHRRQNATQSFSAGQRVAVSPPLPGPIVGAHENGFYTTTPREGGVGFMKYDLVPAGN